MNSWTNTELLVAKLVGVDPTTMTAEVIIYDEIGRPLKKEVKINIDETSLPDFLEMYRYADSAFINSDGELVDWSGLSIWNGTLTQIQHGVDVYE